jgi:hypothetical protein
VHDVKVAWRIPFPAGTLVVDDRGYNDYRLFAYWTDSGVFFVTRMKDNAQFEVVEERAVPQNRPILRDQIIRLSGVGAQDKCPHLLRRVEAVREDTGETLVFLTNHLSLGASTVAAIYKERWQVELFFKALKQNLKVKTFVGTSANANSMCSGYKRLARQLAGQLTGYRVVVTRRRHQARPPNLAISALRVATPGLAARSQDAPSAAQQRKVRFDGTPAIQTACIQARVTSMISRRLPEG